jgi:hypothetical protein
MATILGKHSLRHLRKMLSLHGRRALRDDKAQLQCTRAHNQARSQQRHTRE